MNVSTGIFFRRFYVRSCRKISMMPFFTPGEQVCVAFSVGGVLQLITYIRAYEYVFICTFTANKSVDRVDRADIHERTVTWCVVGDTNDANQNYYCTASIYKVSYNYTGHTRSHLFFRPPIRKRKENPRKRWAAQRRAGAAVSEAVLCDYGLA